MQPCMNPKCWDKIIELRNKFSPCVMLEYGSGYSTIENLKDFDGLLISKERSKDWYDLVLKQVPENKNFIYKLCQEKEEYMEAPEFHCNIILVDGIYREELLEYYYENDYLWDILLLHDAERARYTPYMDLFKDYEQEMILNLWCCYNESFMVYR